MSDNACGRKITGVCSFTENCFPVRKQTLCWDARTATYNVDVASDRRRRENVPRRIFSLKNRKTSSAILKEIKTRSRLAVSVDSHNGEHYNFIYNESDKSFDLSLSKRVIPALRLWDLACFEGVKSNVQI